jgi:hypothetical protein
MSGYLYCFSNESLKNLYKIGMTTRTVEERLKEANSSTWNPDKFKVELSVKVNDVEKKEKIIHQILEEYRSNARREFFEVPLSKVKLIFDLLKEEDIKSQNITEEVKNKAKIEPKGVEVKFLASKSLNSKDCYDEFISEYKEFLETHKEYVDIYTKFYDWFSNKYPKREVPTLESLIANIEKRE